MASFGTKQEHGRRVLALWLPRFATDRLRRDPGAPLAVVEPVRGRPLVVAVNAAAAAGGIGPGMALADARAILPRLGTADADRAGAARDLGRLADWCVRYTPIAAADGTAGVMLDITGCAHLFGGERGLLDDLGARIARLGFAARAAIADTPGAARAIARHGEEAGIIPAGGARVALAGLPPAALGLPAGVVESLRRIGLRRIGDLYDLPRAPLAARFGGIVGRRLDEALGTLFEPVSPCLPVPPYRVRTTFPEPIGRAEEAARTAQRLVAALCRRLERERLGARRLELAFYGLDGAVARAAIGTGRPSRDARHLTGLLREPLADLDLGPGAEVAILAASRVEPLDPAQLALPGGGLGGATESADALARLVDRLAHRLGEGSVVRPHLRESHVPERAVGEAPALSAMPAGVPPARRPRPLRLLARPEPIAATALIPDAPPAVFVWRRLAHRVRRADGPERIAPEWWRDDSAAADATRDYYCLEDSDGRRFWVFRRGLYVPAAAPAWYLHGFFA